MNLTRERPHRRWSGLVTRLCQLNIEAVLGTLVDNGPSTASEIAEATSMSLGTVNRIIPELAADEILTEVPGRYGRPGPRARVYALRPEQLTVAALVHRPGSLTAVRAGPRTFEAPVTLPQNDRPGPDRWAEALRETGTLPGELTCLVAGTVWSDNETPAAQALRTETELSSRLGCPVVVRSTVNLAALAEARLGQARGVEEFLLVTDEGMALVVGGEPRTGAHGAAGSLLTLGDRVFDRTGEPGAVSAVSAVSAIVATCLVTDPELVVLGADRTRNCPPADQIRARLAEVMPTAPRVAQSRMGRLAPALGAVELARELAFAALLKSAS